MSEQPAGRLLSIDRVIDKTSRPRSSIYAAVKAGTFPPPVKVTAQRVAWPEAAVDAWIASKMAAA